MLTTKVITPKQGEFYYAKENYYSAEESVENSQWFGEGAKKLGLKGKVQPKHFKKLLYGELPNGTRFRTKKQERAGHKERAGIDCTFSAPKSVSLLALVEGDIRLEKAHKRAVRRTLKIIEQDYAQTRATKDGQVRVLNTGNLVVGQFHHDTSRELDPHLHTHCVILNMTKHNDKWYAFHNDGIHANKKMLGMIYQNELALEVQKLGYEIEQKGNGQFEIKGFSEEQLMSFSKRRQQIKAKLGSNSTWKEREQAWDTTRIKKGEPIPREELQDYWRKELSDLPFPQPKIDRDGEQINRDDPQRPNVRQALNEAIEHFSERQVAFKPEDLKKFILEEAGKYSHGKVAQAIAKSNELIHLDKLVTTQTALMREIATIRLVKDGQDRVKAISRPETVSNALEELSLTEGQRNAVVMAETTNDQIIAWQGKAGVGKTYALSEFKKIAIEQGYTVKGFAPSAKAANNLSEEINISTTTVARKLVSQTLEEEESQKQIWIVDEAGLLSADDAYELLKRAEEEQARVLLVGDTRQLSSVGAGNPFKSLQQAGITTAYLNQSLRQKTKDLKQAVDLLSDGKIAEGIKILETNKRIEQIGDEEERANRIAQDYLKLTPEDRKQTLVIAGTHKERSAILNSVRTGLKAEGTLGESVNNERLKSKNLTNIQKKYAHYYEVGNVVIPLANYKRTGLEKNQQYIVKAVEGDSLVLLDSAGEERRVSPNHFKYKEVYEAINTDIAVGDRLRWGKNDKELNRVNGEEFIVTQIDNGTATIATETGKIEQIDLKKPQHLDHALVSTTYSSQGLTSQRVLVSVTNDFTLSQESFYVAASRAKYNLQFYVEDKDSLIENASTSRSQDNPLELIREHQRQIAVKTVASTTEPEYKPEPEKPNQPKQSPTPSPKKPKPIIKSKQDITPAPSVSPEKTQETPDPTIPVPPQKPEANSPKINQQPDPVPVSTPPPQHYTEGTKDLKSGGLHQEDLMTPPLNERALRPPDFLSPSVRDSIMENLDHSESPIPDSSLLKLQTEKLTAQIQQLDDSQMSKRKRKDKEYLARQLKDIEAFTQLKEGQQVTLKEIQGTITDLQLSPGGMPVVWVHWDNSTVPIPEQPSRLTVLSNHITKEIQHDTDSQQSQSNLGRYINRSLETSSRKTRQHRGEIDPRRVLSSSPETTGAVNPTSTTVEQPTRADGTEISTISPVIKPNLKRVSQSRRSLNQSSNGIEQYQQQLEQRNQQLGQSNQEFERIKRERKELANRLRVTPLIEVLERLGLEQDRYDPNKYKSDSHIITIDKDNPTRFYDHLNLVGGGGPIDLVMHVQGSKFTEAIDWLNGAAITPTPSISKQHTQQATTTPEIRKEPFTPPEVNESKWLAVKEYLVAKRGLPISIVNELHNNGTIYADSKQNAVFIRKSLDDKITGASLRGTYKDTKFKGLAKGTKRDTGWFSYVHGAGEIERIVLTESPIDSLSAAAISQRPETTLFISTDGSGSIPEDYLRQQLEQGKQILVAYDNDEAGEIMSRKVLDKLPGSVRIPPTMGKDWNEQLIKSEIREIAHKVQQVLNKYGEASLKDDSVTFEGNKLIFSSDDKSMNIYSKSREQVIFEVNPSENRVFYEPNLSEKQILERLKYNPDLQQQQRRNAPKR